MLFREGSDDRGEGEESVQRFKPSHAEVIHHALFHREESLKKDYPDARIEREFQDDEPRAILWLVSTDGSIMAKEFLETAYSIDQAGRDEEYIDAARRYGRIAIHYPGAFVDKEYVIRRLADIWVKIQALEAQERASIQGFLYDGTGRTVLSI